MPTTTAASAIHACDGTSVGGAYRTRNGDSAGRLIQ
jgi:hypothetical protein